MSFPSTTRRPRSGGAGFPRSRRRPTDWARLTGSGTLLVGAKLLVATLTLANVGIAETIRRSILIFNAGAAASNAPGAFGMVVATDTAVAAGAASLPGPITDANDDGWMLWTSVTTDTISQRVHVESRGMRRVEEGYSVVLMGEGGGTASQNFGFALSVLASRV